MLGKFICFEFFLLVFLFLVWVKCLLVFIILCYCMLEILWVLYYICVVEGWDYCKLDLGDGFWNDKV